MAVALLLGKGTTKVKRLSSLLTLVTTSVLSCCYICDPSLTGIHKILSYFFDTKGICSF